MKHLLPLSQSRRQPHLAAGWRKTRKECFAPQKLIAFSLVCLHADGYSWVVMPIEREGEVDISSSSPEDGPGLRSTHLFDPLQQREQPVLIHLAVTVEEGQDSCLRLICPSDSGPDQTCSGTHHVSCRPDGWAMSPGSSSRVSCTLTSPGLWPI